MSLRGSCLGRGPLSALQILASATQTPGTAQGFKPIDFPSLSFARPSHSSSNPSSPNPPTPSPSPSAAPAPAPAPGAAARVHTHPASPPVDVAFESAPEPYEPPEVYDRAYIARKKGYDVLNDPLLNKGTGFTLDERERLGLRGLLPPKVSKIERQVSKVLNDYMHGTDQKVPTDGSITGEQVRKWMYLAQLQDRNETLFYRLLIDNFTEMSPIIYTPTVGWAALNYSAVYRRPRGMYFTAADRGNMNAMVWNWPHMDVDAIVVTDGSRILGLGDLGINGLSIPVGKLDLYVAAAGFHPSKVLPAVIDVGTDNVALREDPTYLGLRTPRISGSEYVAIVDEFVKAVTSRWPKAVLQFEDFKTKNAWYLLERYKNRHLVFNDDIQGTASTALAGMYGAIMAQGKLPSKIIDQRIVVAGAGSAGLGVITMLHRAMVKHGLTEEQAYRNFWIFDKDGLVTAKRMAELDIKLWPFARSGPSELSLDSASIEEVIRRVRPTALIGLTGAGKVFKDNVLKAMGEVNERPIIFPMSNPTIKMECTAEEAQRATGGRAIFASGSPQPDVPLDGGRVAVSNQANNMYIFPGLSLGAFLGQASRVSDGMLMAAAEAVPELIHRDDLARGAVYPPLKDIRRISIHIAVRVMEAARREGLLQSKRCLEVMDNGVVELKHWIKRKMYEPSYSNIVSLPRGVKE